MKVLREQGNLATGAAIYLIAWLLIPRSDLGMMVFGCYSIAYGWYYYSVGGFRPMEVLRLDKVRRARRRSEGSKWWWL